MNLQDYEFHQIELRLQAIESMLAEVERELQSSEFKALIFNAEKRED